MKFKKVLAAFLAAAMVVTGSGISDLAFMSADTVYAAAVPEVAISTDGKNTAAVGATEAKLTGVIKGDNGNYYVTLTGLNANDPISEKAGTVVTDDGAGHIVTTVPADGNLKLFIGSDDKGRVNTSITIGGKKIDLSALKFNITDSVLAVTAGLNDKTDAVYPQYYQNDGTTPVANVTLKDASTKDSTKHIVKAYEIDYANVANAALNRSKTIFGEWTLPDAAPDDKTGPAVTLYSCNNEQKPISSDNFEVTYKNNTRPGVATVTIKAKGDLYDGTLSTRFNVVKTGFTYESVEWPSLPTFFFGQCVERGPAGKINDFDMEPDGDVDAADTAKMVATQLNAGSSLDDAAYNIVYWLTYEPSDSQYNIMAKGTDITDPEKSNPQLREMAKYGHYEVMENSGSRLVSGKYSGYSVTVRYYFDKNAVPSRTNNLNNDNDGKGWYIEHKYSDVVVKKGTIYESFGMTTDPYKTYAAKKVVLDNAKAEDQRHESADLNVYKAQNVATLHKNGVNAAGKKVLVDGTKALFGSTSRDILEALKDGNVGIFPNDKKYVEYDAVTTTNNANFASKKFKLDEVLPSGTNTITITATKKEPADFNVEMHDANGAVAEKLTVDVVVTIDPLAMSADALKVTALQNDKLGAAVDANVKKVTGLLGATPNLAYEFELKECKGGTNYLNYITLPGNQFTWKKGTETLDFKGSSYTAAALTRDNVTYSVTASARENFENSTLSDVEKKEIETFVANEAARTVSVTLRGSNINISDFKAPTKDITYESTASDNTDSRGRSFTAKVNTQANGEPASQSNVSGIDIWYRKVKDATGKDVKEEFKQEKIYEKQYTKFTNTTGNNWDVLGELYPYWFDENSKSWKSIDVGTYEYYFVVRTDNGDYLQTISAQKAITPKKLFVDVKRIGVVDTITSAENESAHYGNTMAQIAGMLKYNGASVDATEQVKKDSNTVVQYLALSPIAGQEKTIKDAGVYYAGNSEAKDDATNVTTTDDKDKALQFRLGSTNGNYTFVDEDDHAITTVSIGRFVIKPAALTVSAADQTYKYDTVTFDGTYAAASFTYYKFTGLVSAAGADSAPTVMANINTGLAAAGATDLANATSYEVFKADDIDSAGNKKVGVTRLGFVGDNGGITFTVGADSNGKTVGYVRFTDKVYEALNGKVFGNYQVTVIKNGTVKAKANAVQVASNWRPYYTELYKEVGTPVFYVIGGSEQRNIRKNEITTVETNLDVTKAESKSADVATAVVDATNAKKVQITGKSFGRTDVTITAKLDNVTYEITIPVKVDDVLYDEMKLTSPAESDKTINIYDNESGDHKKTFQIACAGTGLTYKSADETIATVDANGLVTAVKEGKTTITITDVAAKTIEIAVNVAHEKSELEKAQEEAEAQKKAAEEAAAAEKAAKEAAEKAAAEKKAAEEAAAAEKKAAEEAEAAKKAAEEAAAKAEAEKKAAAEAAAKEAAEAAEKAAAEKAAAEKAAKEAEAKAAAEKAAAEKAAKEAEAAKKAAEAVAAKKVTKGQQVVSGKNIYKVTDVSKKTVTFVGTYNTGKSVKVANTVKIDGTSYKVTQIAAKALKGNKTITKLIIGTNVQKIGKNAFNGCKKLKTVKINSKKVTKIGKNAFKSIKKNATIKTKTAKIKKLVTKSKVAKTVKVK